jgi:hypothetical protein
MKTKYNISAILLILVISGFILRAQTTFDKETYMQFLDQNKTLTCEQLLENNPPKTIYHDSRIYPTGLNDIPWYDTINNIYNLTSAEEGLLENNHFMVSQRLESYGWAEAFINIYSQDLPLFISTDFVLYTLHNSYDAILQTLEWQFLEPNLIELLKAMYNSYPALYNKYSSDSRFNDVLADVDLYVSVAYSLLLNKTYAPQSHQPEKYNEIMQAVSAEQLKFTTLFTESRERKIDFSQFKPRGHYNKIIYTTEGEKTLENYFRAMMWLGRIDFLMTSPPENPWETNWTVDELRRMQLGAILLNELLHSCGKKELMDKHEKIITFLVGPDDNLTPDELKDLTDFMLAEPADLFDNSVYEQFKNKLDASDDYGQKIMSNFFYVDPRSSDPGKLPVSFKLLGQKFLIDSYITSEVVYDRIIYNNKKVHRDLPDPLDVMAVFGNEDAMALLEDEMDKYKYAYKISSLKYLVDAYDEDFWQQSLYNTWLSAIRELNPPATSDRLPYFMQTTAWHHEKLNTQLTSWAELRHDNILYGKQSYTGGTGCSYPYTFIEPYPALYEKLQLFAQNAADFFQEVFDGTQLSSNNYIISYYTGYEKIMGIFKSIARKELAGIPINANDITFLKTMINDYMASGPSISGWFSDLFFDISLGLDLDYIVADVHTQPTDAAGFIVGHVLHVGNGNINKGVFLAPNPTNPKQLMAFTGPVSSFHYEVTNNFYRYTDQEWQEKFLTRTNLPERPDWIAVYMAGNTGDTLPAGRELKGTAYNYTNVIPSAIINDIDYLLAFPNPATNIVHLRFVLNTKNYINIEVYNANGSLVNIPFSNILMPAEHDIPIDLTDWEKGLYIVKLRTDHNVLSRKIMVL